MKDFYINVHNTDANVINALKNDREKRESFLNACEQGWPIFINGMEATYAQVMKIKNAVDFCPEWATLDQFPLYELRKYLKLHTDDSVSLVDRLALDMEWAEGHEWDAPISLYDDLKDAIHYIGPNPVKLN